MDLGEIIKLLILAAIIGGIIWAAQHYLGQSIPSPILNIIIFAIIAFALLWLASALGVVHFKIGSLSPSFQVANEISPSYFILPSSPRLT